MKEIKESNKGQKRRLTYTLNLENIPAELKRLKQWVGWRAEWKVDKDKFTKVPVNPNTGRNASSTNSKTWGAFEEAVEGMHRYRLDGVGIVLTEDLDIVGVDVDNCYIDGLFTEEALVTMNALDTYTEFSPSGKGIRLFAYGNLPKGRRKKEKFEMYNTGRFLTITGMKIVVTTVVQYRQSAIEYIHKRFLADTPKKPLQCARRNYFEIESDTELLRKIENSKQGDKFKSLYRGDITGYPSQSEAELALCNILAYWTNGDSARIDVLFRGSELLRRKWDDKRGETTIGGITIRRALNGSNVS